MPNTTEWASIEEGIRREIPDVLITNEMPFGRWIYDSPRFDRAGAQEAVNVHEQSLHALYDLPVPIVISSRPVWNGEVLANEAFRLESGVYTVLHHKQYFPDEAGWFEERWFAPKTTSFGLASVSDCKVGVLLCTELMFNEHARSYGRRGAHLIVVPRATGSNMDMWTTAARMAAIVSGAYVFSSNRVGSAEPRGPFGGGGFIVSPDAKLLGVTDAQRPILTFTLEEELVKAQKSAYPVYVKERQNP